MKLEINGVVVESTDREEIKLILDRISKTSEPFRARVAPTTRKRWSEGEIAYLKSSGDDSIMKIRKRLKESFGKVRTEKAVIMALRRFKK